MSKIKIWIRAIRAPFFSVATIPGIIASFLAYNEGNFNWLYFIISIIIIAGTNCGINLANDYYDHISKNDEINKYSNPFSGGSRVIQEKMLHPKSILIGAIVSFIVVAIIGLYFTFTVNFNLIWFGLAGIFLGYFYNAPPFKFGYKGLGEFLVFLMDGPIATLGTYFLFTGRINLKSVLISIPPGLLVALVLLINEFPDYFADKEVNKKTLIVRLGRKKASYLYTIVIVLFYLSVIIPVTLGLLPLFLLIVLINLPIAIKSILVAIKNYKNEREIFPAQVNTILLAITSGILLSVGFILDRILIK